MAICTKCGAIFDDTEANKHVCKSENIPAKGKEKIPASNEVAIE